MVYVCSTDTLLVSAQKRKKKLISGSTQDLPEGPVVKNPSCHCRECGFEP